MKVMKSTLFILVSLILLSVFESQAQGETQTIGGVETEGTLRISVYDNGDMSVDRYSYSNSDWQQQWFGPPPDVGNHKSTLLYIGGNLDIDSADYAVEDSYYNGGSFYSYATPLETKSNTSFPDTDELVLELEKSGVVSIIQTIHYPPGAAYFTLQWEITNLSDSTVNDLRFFSGGDTFLSGIDEGAGFWQPEENAVGVKKMITATLQQNMYIQGNTIPYAYESRYYINVGGSVVENALTDAIDPSEETDNGMAMEWRKESLAAGAIWTIHATEKFITKEVSDLLVSAPISGQVAPGSSIDLTYSVTNLTESETNVTLNKTIDLGGWTAVIQSPASPFTLAGNASQDVVILVTCPGGTALGTVAKVTLEATSDSGTANDFCNVEAAQVPTITSHPSDRSVNAGESASFTISAENATSYQWQEFSDSWRDVTDEGIYSGAMRTTLNISSASAEMNGYKYRCVATNDYGSSTSNTATLTIGTSAPTVTTTATSSITATTASSGGNVTSDGGASVTAKGVCWSTSADPTTADNHTSDGTGTGTFTSSITGLSPGTEYHVRAYAINTAGTAYGRDKTFTTSTTAPTVTTTAASSITATTASSGGNVTSDRGASVTARGVCWSTSADPTTADSKTTDGTGTGTFTSSITGLTPNTTYHVRAYATNSDSVTGYGSDKAFTTSAVSAPTLTTTDVSSITTTTASSGGDVTSDGGASITARGVCWSASADPTTADSKTTDGTGTGTFTSSITGLTPNTTYHVRAYATNSDSVTGYGSDKSFTTAALAGTYYVNIASGDDSNNGTSAHPWKTLHHAISQINGGGSGTYVLHVALGTYSVANGEANSGLTLTQNDVTIIGASGSAPLLDGTGATNWTKGFGIESSNSTIRNLYITGFSDNEEMGIEFNSGSNNVVENCKVYGNYEGINIGSTTSGNTIRGCESYQNGKGILCYSSNNVISKNTIHDNTNDGVYVRDSSPEVSRNEVYDNQYGISVDGSGSATASPTIKNNLIYEATLNDVSFGITIGGNGTSTVNPRVYHNTIDGGIYEGVIVEKYENSSINPEIKYNIITNFRQYGIQNSGGNPTIDYNDVWNNGSSASDNYKDCTAGANDISQDPLYGSYELQSTSPCIDAIGHDSGDPVRIDYPGYSRPRNQGYDMGAYEYVGSVEYPSTLPGGTGLVTNYRIFTVPLDMGTGADLQSTMEVTLEAYDPATWRVFGYYGGLYYEMGTPAFSALNVVPGMAFWIITFSTSTIPFEGGISPDGVSYQLELPPDWSLIALPWTDTNINLGNIAVTDGVNTYAITNQPDDNKLTQECVWDYSGSGPYSGYEKRDLPAYTLQCGTGYFIKVLAGSNVKLIIPPENVAVSTVFVSDTGGVNSAGGDEEEPPLPPGGSYEPVPDIHANEAGGTVTVSPGSPVSIKIGLNPGDQIGVYADWWIAAYTPFGWYSYVHNLQSWQSGIHAAAQAPLFELTPPFEVLNASLPPGVYTFYFAVDGNMDGKADATWYDSVEVDVRR